MTRNSIERHFPVNELSALVRVQRPDVALFIREILQDIANLMANRRQTVQFVLRGWIDRGQSVEVRQPDGQYVNLSSIFGARLRQEANDWLVASLWL